MEGKVQAEAINGGLGGGEVEFGRGGIQSRKSDRTSSSFLSARAALGPCELLGGGRRAHEQSSDVEPNTTKYPCTLYRYTSLLYPCNLQLYMSTR